MSRSKNKKRLRPGRVFGHKKEKIVVVDLDPFGVNVGSTESVGREVEVLFE